MKCFFATILIIASFKAISQEPVSSVRSYVMVQDSIMQHLDKSKLQSGALYDRVFHWANAQIVKHDDSINGSLTRQLWHELYLSKYDSGLVDIESAIQKSRSNMVEQQAISLGYISYDFETIDSNAYLDGRLAYGADSLLYNGTDTTSPLPRRVSPRADSPFMGTGAWRHAPGRQGHTVYSDVRRN